MKLKDKVIIVTGGTGVLGDAFVNGIAAQGGVVGILGRNEKLASDRTAKLTTAGYKAIALVADVLDEEQLIAVKNQVIGTYGRIDGLVNGAGGNMPGGIIQPNENIFSLKMDGLRQVLDLNLYGTLLPTQVFGAEMAKTGNGSIVNISSMAAQRVITKVLGYTLAKSAIESYTRWFAVEMANRYSDKLRMNAIAPGFFLTEQNRALLTTTDGALTDRGHLVVKQTPFKRFGEPSELIGTLIWLLSEDSKFVTGSVVNVDGGFAVSSGV